MDNLNYEIEYADFNFEDLEFGDRNLYEETEIGVTPYFGFLSIEFDNNDVYIKTISAIQIVSLLLIHEMTSKGNIKINDFNGILKKDVYCDESLKILSDVYIKSINEIAIKLLLYTPRVLSKNFKMLRYDDSYLPIMKLKLKLYYK